MENEIKECCGTCKWHWCQQGEWYCNNKYSENYEEFTEYYDECDSYEERT